MPKKKGALGLQPFEQIHGRLGQSGEQYEEIGYRVSAPNSHGNDAQAFGKPRVGIPNLGILPAALGH